MSKLHVSTIEITADNPREALSELRMKLEDEGIPSHVVDKVVEAKAQEWGILSDSNSQKPTPEDTAKLKAETIERAKAIAKLPKEKQFAAMQEVILDLGRKFGVNPERALETANKARDEVNEMFRVLTGHDFLADAPELQGDFTKRADQVKQREVSTTHAQFRTALGKLKEAGYTDEAIDHIAVLFRMQDSMEDFVSNVFDLGSYTGAHKHVPSAKLVLDIYTYQAHANEMMYSMCRRANVDPQMLGFLSEDAWRENQHALAPVIEDMRKTVENC